MTYSFGLGGPRFESVWRFNLIRDLIPDNFREWNINHEFYSLSLSDSNLTTEISDVELDEMEEVGYCW